MLMMVPRIMVLIQLTVGAVQVSDTEDVSGTALRSVVGASADLGGTLLNLESRGGGDGGSESRNGDVGKTHDDGFGLKG